MIPSQRTNSAAPFDAALPYTAAAAISLAILSVFGVPATFRLGIPALLMAGSFTRALAAYLTRERLRERADVWLADSRSPNPSVFSWRIDELVGTEREVVGHTLQSIAREVMRPRRPRAPILNRPHLRAEAELLSELAQALRDPGRSVSPRAIVGSRLLITDCGSPLNCSARHDELHQALESILAEISAAPVSGAHEPQESPAQRNAATQRTSRSATRKATR